VTFERLYPLGSPASAAELADEVKPPPSHSGSRPFVYLNMIATLDGRAALGGSTRALGGGADLELLLELRAGADAVLIGTGTVRAEGYDRLVKRAEHRARRVAAGRLEDPLAVLVSRSGDVPWTTGLFAASEQPVLVYAPGELPDVAAPVELAPPRALLDVLADLRARGVRRLLCEGGPGLNGALFAAGVVDALCLTIVPAVTGDEREPTIVAGPALPGAVGLRLGSVARHGDELFLRYERADAAR
jgi:riboflavin biosynthesis pyrimidine reductase